MKAVVEAVATTPADVETPQMIEKKRKFQELIDSINFSNPRIDDIRKMLKVTNPFDTTCTFLCNPDECDEQMLEKLRQKYMEKIKNIEDLKIDQACQIFDNILNDNLFLILENLYVQSKKISKENLKILVTTCSTAIAQTFNQKDVLHKIMFILYSKFLKSFEISENESKQNLENMQKLLQLLNSMTPQNMQKLLQLLNSMTPKTMGDLLYVLTHDVDKNNINKILDEYNNLDTESMAQLLELYSFIEKREYTDNTRKYLIHRYKNGNTPLSQRLLRNTKHKPTTCKSVKSLNNTANQLKTRDGIQFLQDMEFEKVLKECGQTPLSKEVVTGGRRRRKTLKKKRRYVNKR